MESIELLWARSLFALEMVADQIGLSRQQMLVALQSHDSDVINKLGPELFSLASLTWSYLDEYEKWKSMKIDDSVDWAYRVGNLFGRLELHPNQHGFNPVECGRKGSEARHKPMRELRAWAVARYQERKWPTANAAATELEQMIVEHGHTIGATLSKSNARRTIAEWFRKSV